MDAIDSALVFLFDLLKMLISVLFDTIKMMITIFGEVASETIKLIFKKNK